MNETVYNKLVRDKIPELIESSGRTPVYHALADDEFLQRLDAKLLEEVQEYLENPCIDEIADILEVLEAIVAMRKYPQPELRRAKNAKTLKRGSFTKKIFLEKVIDP